VKFILEEKSEFVKLYILSLIKMLSFSILSSEKLLKMQPTLPRQQMENSPSMSGKAKPAL